MVAARPDREWKCFPPDGDRRRIADYDRYEKLFKGKVQVHRYNGAKIFDLGSLVRKTRPIGIEVNYPGIISRVCADLLFGEAPRFAIGEPDSLEQQALTEILEANDFLTQLYESALSSSYRGDAVFRVRWGPVEEDGEDQVVIEGVPAFSYFPLFSLDNCRFLRSQAVAWLREDGILRVETHMPGRVRQQAFRCDESGDVGAELDLAEVYPLAQDQPLPDAPTGIPGSLLFHVPNSRIDSEFFGMSDYYDLESLFEAINNRLSKIDQYLDRHAGPKLVGLPGVMKPDGTLNMESLEYLESQYPELSKFLPRYVTWDGQMGSSFMQIEVLIDFIFKVSEIAPAVFGLDKAGAIESGRAMKMRFIRTIAKINRKRLYFTRAIKNVLKAALQLWAVRNNKTLDLKKKIEIFWSDGLPKDYQEEVDASVKRIASGTQAPSTAVMGLDGTSRTEAVTELERAAKEKKEFGGAPPTNSLGGTPNGGGTEPGPGPGGGQPGPAGPDPTGVGPAAQGQPGIQAPTG